MLDILIYEFSLSDVVNGAIGAMFITILGLLLRHLTPRLWRYILAGVKTRRRRNYIQIWKRLKSDEYYQSCRNAEIISAVIVLALPILILEIVSTMKVMTQQLDWEIASFIFLLTFCWFIILIVSSWERAVNEKALVFRMRAERQRKKPLKNRG